MVVVCFTTIPISYEGKTMSDTIATPEATPLPNIYQRINAVRSELAYVQKDTRVDGKYSAVSHDMVTAALRPHLIKHGIIVIPSLRDQSEIETDPPKEGKSKNRLFSFVYEVLFVNSDNPDDTTSMLVPAHGADTLDKACGKAMSMAVKYALLKMFSLESGDNEESRMGEIVDDDLVATAMALITEAENMDELHTGFKSAVKLVRSDPGALKTLNRVKESRKKHLASLPAEGGAQ